MSSKKQQPSYYSVIIAEVRYSKKINANEKLLYSEISALTNKYGYCWSSNKYFSKLYDCTPQAISKWISNLEKNGFISCERIYAPGGKEIKKRIIRLANNFEKMPYSEENEECDSNDDGSNSDDQGINQCVGGSNNSLHPYQHRIKGNNTSYNNTSNNNNTPYSPPEGDDTVSTFEQPTVSTLFENEPVRKSKTIAEQLEGFDTFYDAYAKKVNRDKAERAWLKLKPEERQKAIEVVSEWVSSMVNDKQFQPHPATWLNGKRFNDELSDENIPAEKLAAAGKKLSSAKKIELSELYKRQLGIIYHPPTVTDYMAPMDNIIKKQWWVDPSGFLHMGSNQYWAVYREGVGHFPGNPMDKAWSKV